MCDKLRWQETKDDEGGEEERWVEKGKGGEANKEKMVT